MGGGRVLSKLVIVCERAQAEAESSKVCSSSRSIRIEDVRSTDR